MDKKRAKEPNSQMLVPALLFEAGLILDTRLLQKQLSHQQKLYCLAGPAHLGVLAIVEKARDVDAEVRGQRPADVEVGSSRLRGLRSEGIRSRSQRYLVRSSNQEVLGHETRT